MSPRFRSWGVRSNSGGDQTTVGSLSSRPRWCNRMQEVHPQIRTEWGSQGRGEGQPAKHRKYIMQHRLICEGSTCGEEGGYGRPYLCENRAITSDMCVISTSRSSHEHATRHAFFTPVASSTSLGVAHWAVICTRLLDTDVTAHIYHFHFTSS